MFDFFNIVSAPSISTPNEKVALSCLGASLPDKSVIVEIGSSVGGSASIFTHCAPTSSLYCIDIVDTIDATLFDRSKIFFCQGTTADFLDNNADIAIDLLFIDGDHSFSGAYSDFMRLFPRVKEDGIIVFHDVDLIHPGVYVFVETLKRAMAWRDFEQIDSLCIFKKKNTTFEFKTTDYRDTLGLLANSVDFTIKETAPLLQFESFLAQGNTYRIGCGEKGCLSSLFLGLDFTTFTNSDQVSDRRAKCIVFSSFFQEIYSYLVATKHIIPGNIIEFTDKILSHYIFRDLVENNAQTVLRLCNDPYLERIFQDFILKSSAYAIDQTSLSQYIVFLISHYFFYDGHMSRWRTYLA